jgi:hypothetical protein
MIVFEFIGCQNAHLFEDILTMYLCLWITDEAAQ